MRTWTHKNDLSAVFHLIQGSVEVKKREGKDDSSPALLSSPKNKLRGCFYMDLLHSTIETLNNIMKIPLIMVSRCYTFIRKHPCFHDVLKSNDFSQSSF
jgi:hypothetical protein